MTTNDSAAVQQAAEALREAILRADSAALNELTADELVYGHTSGRTETKAQFIEGVVSGKSAYAEITVTAQSIKVIDNVALVNQSWDAVRSNAAPGVRLKLTALNVWLRRSGRWQLVARQAVK
jgi:hypothetical protein